MSNIQIHHGSGNVYKDLGFPDAEEMQAKAILASRIMEIVKKKKWTQKKSAEILGITQPKISLLKRGHFSGFSIGKLINMLNKLQQDIEIIIKDRPSLKNIIQGMSLSLMRKLDSKSETLEEKSTSPLDIEDTDINITIEDIITFIHDSRKNKTLPKMAISAIFL